MTKLLALKEELGILEISKSDLTGLPDTSRYDKCTYKMDVTAPGCWTHELRFCIFSTCIMQSTSAENARLRNGWMSLHLVVGLMN